MKLKRAIGIMLLIVIVLTQFSGFTYARDLTANKNSKSTITNKWHYEQIKSKDDAISKAAKIIYEAMEEMATSGKFKDSANLDIAERFTQGEITKYLKGDSTLKEAMNAARYAFYADHPEIFYVDFSKITLRITQERLEDGSIKYHAYVGAGTRSNYYTNAFQTRDEIESAVSGFEEKISSIVNSEEKPSDIKDLIKYAHNEIVYNANYTYESDLTETEKVAKYSVGSPYGILVKGKGVCEGYARAFKTILDELGITCILVQGFHTNGEDMAIEHMWNYVQLGDKWYAVDCTLDDPFVFDTAGNKVYGYEHTGHLLVGRLAMSSEHTAIGKVEAAGGYEFIYPELNEEDEGVDKASEVIVEKDQNRKLLVKYKKFGTEQKDEDGNIFQAGDFYISYNGQNASEIRNKRKATDEEKAIFEQYKKDPDSVDKSTVKDVDIDGNVDGDDATYILMRESKTKSDGVVVTNWFYFLTDEYEAGLKDHPTTDETPGYTFMSAPHIQRLEFAITKVPPTGYLANNTASLKALYYQGTEEEILATSGWLDNPTGTYIGRPYVLKQTPSATEKLSTDNNYTFDVEATFTDDLVEKVEKGEDPLGKPIIDWVEAEGEVAVSDEEVSKWVKLVTSTKSAAEYSTITNFKWDGKNKVSFKIEVSKMFADDQCNYSVYLPKLAGKESHKTPMPVVFGVGHSIGCTICMNNAGSWSFFATPTLIESGDLSTKDWKYKDENGNLSDAKGILNTKLALVTTRPTYEKQEDMMTEIEKKESAILASETYNISINACKRIIVPNEHKLQLALGFPPGYGPDDEGVTFKVYHFKKDGTPEEVDCIVTKLGLVVLCDDFSPYAVVAVEDDTQSSNKTKQVVVAYNENGTVTGNGIKGGILTLAEGAKTTLTITAKDTHKVEKVTIGGENVNIARPDQTITINVKNGAVTEEETNTYDISEGNGIISIGFVENEVVEAEGENQTLANVELEPAEITMTETEKTLVAGNKLELTPTVTSIASENNISYQWYKTNPTTGARETVEKEALGANGKEKTLTISEVEAKDAGSYMLEATVSSVDGQTRTSISQPYTLTVEVPSFTATVSKVGTETIYPNSEFEVKVSISDFQNIHEGLVIAGGELKYDTDVLELVSLTGINGWNASIERGNETVSGINGTKFIIDREDRGTAGDVFIVKFRAKTVTTGTIVTLDNLETTEGQNVIVPATINPATIVVSERPTTPSTPSFGDYKVEGYVVSRIRPKTTVSSLKSSISGGVPIVKDKDGNVLENNQFIATGDKVTVGGNEYTLVVTGDIDGNREIGVNDLARLKLYYINLITSLTPIEMKAADLNGDGRFTIVDLGQLKLYLIGLINEGDIKIK